MTSCRTGHAIENEKINGFLNIFLKYPEKIMTGIKTIKLYSSDHKWILKGDKHFIKSVKTVDNSSCF